jgi:hypothetical protein
VAAWAVNRVTAKIRIFILILVYYFISIRPKGAIYLSAMQI